jgi:two-component system, cell cycle sensor histidine kinase and response regulator CckA
MLSRIIGQRVKLRSQLAPGLAPIRCDRSQLDQVILNLCLNARDAMPEGGLLVLSTRNEVISGRSGVRGDISNGQYVVLSVSDTGIGMDEEVRSRLFEPFFTTKHSTEGTGLGLPTVFGIVTQANGRITVESSPGEGATFTVHFPAADRDPPPASGMVHSNAAATRPEPPGKPVILLAEDEESVRGALAKLLRSAGFEVLLARDGGEALEVASGQQGEIALLLSDVIMPGMGGLELAERFSALYPHTRMILMSGYGHDPELRKKASAAHIEFVAKPFDVPDLLRMVRELTAP